MWLASDIIRLVSIFFNLVSGLTLNAYIVSVYVREWGKKKAFNLCDRIVLMLALTGTAYQCSFSFEVLNFYFGSRRPNIYNFVLNIFFMNGICWNTAWLSTYYCLKLLKCSHHTFLQVKTRLSSSIMWLLMVSMLGLFFMTLPLPSALRFHYENITLAISGIRPYSEHYVPYISLYMVLGSFLPFLQSFICIGLSVKSLLDHVQQIRQNSSQFSSSTQLEGHLRAARTMILQVCLCMVLYLAALSILLFSTYIGLTVKVFISVIASSYASLQAAILIQGNPKLRKRPPTCDT